MLTFFGDLVNMDQIAAEFEKIILGLLSQLRENHFLAVFASCFDEEARSVFEEPIQFDDDFPMLRSVSDIAVEEILKRVRACRTGGELQQILDTVCIGLRIDQRLPLFLQAAQEEGITKVNVLAAQFCRVACRELPWLRNKQDHLEDALALLELEKSCSSFGLLPPPPGKKIRTSRNPE